MKKSSLLLFVVFNQFCFISGQDAYKQNFLNLLKSLPDIQTCEDSYKLLKCADNSCLNYKAAKSDLEKAQADLIAAQLASNASIASASQPATMTPDQAKELKAKLDKMSPAEKQKWTMQYAQNVMGASTVHVNKNIDNTVVNDAVEYVTNLQAEDLNEMLKPVDVSSTFMTIEEKYLSQKNSILKIFQTASGVSYDPSTTSPYVFGETSDAQIAKFNKALLEYKKSIKTVYNAELKDKLDYLRSLTQKLTEKFSLTEEKIVATHYAEDAKETVNKSHLFMAHKMVLGRIMEHFGNYQVLLQYYANKYADLEKTKRIE